MQTEHDLHAAGARLARSLHNATVARWPGGRFIVIVTLPGRSMPLRFVGDSPDACVDMALKQLVERPE